MVHISKDVTTALGKRVDDEFRKLLVEYVKLWGTSVKSSDAHASSESSSTLAAPLSSAPAPEYVPLNIVESLDRNPSSSTANPDPLMELSSPLSTAPKQGSFEDHFIIIQRGMTYFRIKARMSCMDHCTPQRQQSMARAMN
jgi:hypothetical protein